MKKVRLPDFSLKSFTLTEVLVVLIIVGILILLALPNLMPLITRAKSTEAKLQLQHIYTPEKNYFYEKSKYSGISEGYNGKKFTPVPPKSFLASFLRVAPIAFYLYI